LDFDKFFIDNEDNLYNLRIDLETLLPQDAKDSEDDYLELIAVAMATVIVNNKYRFTVIEEELVKLLNSKENLDEVTKLTNYILTYISCQNLVDLGLFEVNCDEIKISPMGRDVVKTLLT
jgi:hypothetical protein